MHRGSQTPIEAVFRPQPDDLLLGHQIVEGLAIGLHLLIQPGQLALHGTEVVILTQGLVELVKIGQHLVEAGHEGRILADQEILLGPSQVEHGDLEPVHVALGLGQMATHLVGVEKQAAQYQHGNGDQRGIQDQFMTDQHDEPLTSTGWTALSLCGKRYPRCCSRNIH